MDDIINTFKCAAQTLLISDIADEEAKLVCIFLEFIFHHPLFKFVSGINDHLFGVVVLHDITGKAFAERAGTTCDQNCFTI